MVRILAMRAMTGARSTSNQQAGAPLADLPVFHRAFSDPRDHEST
jgi:hypothetical protein